MSKSKANKNRNADFDDRNAQYSAFRTVFFYCLLIILMPIITFFTTKNFLFDGLLQLSNVSSNIYSAVSAVIALHVALGIYLYKAYFEGSSSKEKHQPKSKSSLDKQD